MLDYPQLDLEHTPQAAGVEEQIDSFNASSYSGAEYTVMIGLGTYRQSQKLMVMHDDTTAYSQEYAIMSTPEPQVSIGATLDSGNVLIKVTPLCRNLWTINI